MEFLRLGPKAAAHVADPLAFRALTVLLPIAWRLLVAIRQPKYSSHTGAGVSWSVPSGTAAVRFSPSGWGNA